MVALGLGIITTGTHGPNGLGQRLMLRSRQRMETARISANPRTYLTISILAPPALFAIGWIESALLAVAGGIAGLLAPRLYVASLVAMQSRRSEAQAPQLLQALTSGLSAGGTYLDALRRARSSTTDPWIAEDLDGVIQRFLLNGPLHDSLQEVRSRTAGRNLGLIWETLRICTEHHLPTEKARNLLLEISATVQFNVQLANEVRARSAGQRAQIWLLAIIVPAMYLYLRMMSPQLLSVLDQTMLGRLVLFPLATALEVTGLVLSFRLARVGV